MTTRADLERLIDRQQSLRARLEALHPSAQEILQVGAEVLEFAEREEDAFFPLLPLLDPIARAELAHEHDEMREDLQLLEWLLSTSPDSPDIDILAAAVVDRMRKHVERDGRLLLRASRLTLS